MGSSDLAGRSSATASLDDSRTRSTRRAQRAALGARRSPGAGAVPRRAPRPRGRRGKDVVELGCGTAYVSRAGSRGVARVRSGSTSRRRSSRRAARSSASGLEFPLVEAERGGRAAPGRDLRPRRLRVRRDDLGRSVQVGSGGGAAATDRRRARLPRNSTLVKLCTPDPTARSRAAGADPVRHAPVRVGEDGRRVPPPTRGVDPAAPR